MKMIFEKNTNAVFVAGVIWAMLPASGCNRAQLAKPENPDLAPANVAPMTFQRTFNAMSAVTGIPISEGNVRARYNQLLTALPTRADVSTLQPSHHIAIMQLGTEFCDRMMQNGTLRAQALPAGFNVNQAPATAFATQDAKVAVARALTNQFWNAEDENQIPSADAEAQLSLLMTDLMAGAPANSGGTMQVLIGTCAAVLSSSRFIFM